MKLYSLTMKNGKKSVFIGLFPSRSRAKLIECSLDWSSRWKPTITIQEGIDMAICDFCGTYTAHLTCDFCGSAFCSHCTVKQDGQNVCPDEFCQGHDGQVYKYDSAPFQVFDNAF